MKDESRQALEALGMDLDQTLQRFVGNEGLLFRFLGRFPSDTTFEQMKAAMQAHNAEDAFHQAHTLKGVVGNLGLGNIFNAVDPMVEMLRNGEFEQAESLFPQLEAAYTQTIETLTSLNEGA